MHFPSGKVNLPEPQECNRYLKEDKENKMKKFNRPVMVLFIAVLLLSACTPRAAAPADRSQVTLNIWGFEGETEFFPELIQQFEADNPGITVQLTEIPEGDYVTKIDTALLAGEGPDIAFVYVPRWLKAGKFVALDSAIEEYQVPFNDFNQGAITRDCVFEGKVYCLGTYTGAILMLYNKDIFDAAGVAYPSPDVPWSMQEYFNATLSVTTQSDNIEERVWGGDAMVHTWWMDWRTHISNDGRTIDGYANDDATVTAYQLMADMRTAGSAMSNADAALVQMESQDLFAQGKFATVIVDNILAIPAAEAAGLNWGAAIVPTERKGDPAWTTTWTDGFGVLSTSRNQEAAIKFVTYMGTKGNELRLELGYMPLNMKLAEQWIGNSEGRRQAYDAIEHASENLFVPGYWEATGYIWDAWTEMLEDDVSASEALNSIAPLMQETLDLTWETFDSVTSE
jgi:multiple sugar transport system substrate-binding protein